MCAFHVKEIIGSATLYLGDCREIVPELEFDSVVADPPYGIKYNRHIPNSYDAIKNDASFELLSYCCNIPVKHSRYVFCRWDCLYHVPKPKSCITWVKNNFTMGDLKHEHGKQTELILFWPGKEHSFPYKRPSDVIIMDGMQGVASNHQTEKPIHLMRRIVQWTNGMVLDPCMGSGSTGVAAVKMNRQFIGIEIDKKNFSIACRRIWDTLRQGELTLGESAAIQ